MWKNRFLLCLGVVAVVAGAPACRKTVSAGGLAAGDAAAKVYVAPGQKDELYMFASGGFSGNVAVYGLPSGRLFAQVPVFSQEAGKGERYTEESKGTR